MFEKVVKCYVQSHFYTQSPLGWHHNDKYPVNT